MKSFFTFFSGSLKIISRGRPSYYVWMGVLALCLIQGVFAYVDQCRTGLILSNMRDSVSWGYYIGNFTFLVGVAAAAVLLVIPAYIYNWKPIKEVVIFGELLAVAAIAMCLMFVMVDMGRPDRFWHIIPMLGRLNFPSSVMAWDAIVLNVYFVLNLFVATYLLFCTFHGKAYNRKILIPLVILSIPAAVSIHTVTAFLYNGMASRPYWNSAILAPRFIASAFCSGPAILLILFQVLRKFTRFEISNAAIHKIAELMAYAMFINLFLFGAEVFKEFYSDTHHLVHYKFLLGGLPTHTTPIVYFAWTSIIFAIASFFLFVVPKTRRNPVTMNIGCVMIYLSVYIEKGIALIVPGYTPDMLGQFYHYSPSLLEFRVAMGIFGIGFLIFTLMVKIAVDILFGERATHASLAPVV